MSKLDRDHALVVLSGGQDSTTCLHWAQSVYGKVSAITFDYGQRHSIEIEAAKKISQMAGVTSHEIVNVPQILASASPLTSDNELDRYENFQKMEEQVGDKIEKTFVPMRNTLFLTIAANRAVAFGASVLVTGICQQDNANYPDCTEDFRRKLENTFNESLGLLRENFDVSERLTIAAPLMYLSKAQTVRMATTLPGCMKSLAYSHTSYDGKYPPVDKNHSNLLRAQGFEEAGVADPLVLRAWYEGLMKLPVTSNYTDYLVDPVWGKEQVRNLLGVQ